MDVKSCGVGKGDVGRGNKMELWRKTQSNEGNEERVLRMGSGLPSIADTDTHSKGWPSSPH